MKPTVSLLALRCKDVEVTRRFYEYLGIVFVEEKHGTGVRHYAWENDDFVLELYPATGDQPSENVRLGFSTPVLADVASNLQHAPQGTVLKPPYATAERLVMVLQDPDGRKVEVSQRLER